MVVAKALAIFSDNSLLQTGDLVLAARVRALFAAGLLEAQGNLFNLRRSEVRLPASA